MFLFHTLKPGFHIIVSDHSRSLVNSLAIVAIILKPNFHFASHHQQSQRLPTIAMISIAGIELEFISIIVTIVIHRQQLQRFNRSHHYNNCSDPNDPNCQRLFIFDTKMADDEADSDMHSEKSLKEAVCCHCGGGPGVSMLI